MRESDNKSQSDKRKITKRHAIKAVGGTIGGVAFPFGQATATMTGEYNGEGTLVTVPRSEALTPQEVFNIQNDVIAKFRSNNDLSQKLKIGLFQPADKYEIHALSFRVDGDGQVSVYMGGSSVEKPTSKGEVATLHKTAKDHAEKVRDGVQSKRVNHEHMTGVVSAGYATGWDQMVAEYAFENTDCPAGKIYAGGEVYEKQGTSYYGYGVDTSHRTNPGQNYCSNSGYNVNDTYLRHEWDAFTADSDPIFHEHFPNTDRDGSFTVDGSASYGGATIGVSYNPPDVYRDVRSEYNGTNNAEWDWDYTWDPSTDTQHNTTSILKSDNEAAYGGSVSYTDTLLRVESGANFTDHTGGNTLVDVRGLVKAQTN
jgi:hypothetical protein